MRAFAALLVIAACGAREVTPVPDYGPPPRRFDPIACPAAMLDVLATRIPGAQLAVSLERVVDAARVDKVPCGELADDACLARARKRPVPVGYEVVGVTIGGDVTHVDVTYELDGRRITEQAPSLAAMVEKLKALQAAGHHVRVIAGESASDAESRHAAIAYRAAGGQQRRVGTYRWRVPDGETAASLADAHAAAEAAQLQVRSVEVTDDGVVMTATCAALVHAELPPDGAANVSPGI